MIAGSLKNRVQTWARQKRWYRQLRGVLQRGVVRSMVWQSRERRILRSAPILTQRVGTAGAPCEVRLMTWKGDWRLALWAAKSFYHFAKVDWPIAFHDGGGLDQDICRELRKHFPQATVVGWDEGTSLVEPRLVAAGYEHVARARRLNVMVRKLVDFAVLSQAPRMICMDSDVLFVGEPEQLRQLGETETSRLWFNRDSHDMYSISAAEAREWFQLELPPQINAGLSLIPVSLVDLEFLNRAYAPDRIPLDRDVFPEQTVCALLSARRGPAYLGPEYTVATGTPPLDVRRLGLVSRHYVGPVRHLLYEEGMPYLIKETNLVSSARRLLPAGAK